MTRKIGMCAAIAIFVLDDASFSGAYHVAVAEGDPEPRQVTAKLPNIISENLRVAAEKCNESVTYKKGFLTRRDVNGDKVFDYVIDYSYFTCGQNASFACGSGGCTLEVFVSTGGPKYEKAFSDTVLNYRFRKIAGKSALLLSMHGSFCGNPGFQDCKTTLYWDGRRFSVPPAAAKPSRDLAGEEKLPYPSRSEGRQQISNSKTEPENHLRPGRPGGGWQYAQWGMTPGEVQMASASVAIPFTDSGKNSETSTARLIAPYSAEGVDFKAIFGFDKANGLNVVTLEANSQPNCPALVGALSNTYGPPQDQLRTAVTTSYKWYDSIHRTVVVYLQIGGAYCSVQYAPWNVAGRPGGL